MSNVRRLTRAIVTALGLIVVGAASAVAQVKPAGRDVTVLNEQGAAHKVFAVDANGGLHFLGRVANGEIKDFDVPTAVESLGPYRIALQEILPPPTTGVRVADPPFKATSPTMLRGGKMIVMIGEATVSTAEVF